MATEVTLTPDERLQLLSDMLVAGAMGNDEGSIKNRKFLFGQVSPKVFRNENYIILSVFYNFKDRGITPDVDFLKMFLMRNQKMIKDSYEYIDLNAYADLDENPIIGYITAVINQYTRLQGIVNDITEDYALTLEKYKSEFCNYEMNKAYSDSKLILYDGLQIGRRLYQGYDDSVAYVKRKMSDIESLLDHTKGEGFVDSRVAGIEDGDKAHPTKIGDFGLVRELNEALGGIYTSLFYSFMAPTKGGKSKFTARLAHIIAVEYGNNISVWAHEGGYTAWWAQLRAIHFEYMYIRGKDPSQRPAPLSQKQIMQNDYPSEAIRQLEMASRQDLFTNPKYGNFHMIDRPFYVETFIDEIETSVQLNQSKAVLVDYLQLIDTMDKGKSKPQVIGRAYQAALSYANKRNVAFMSPAQFTQDFMNEMAKSKDGQQHEVRTAGGESSEIVRTPDVNIALYATTDDLRRKEMTLMAVPSRIVSSFPDTKIYADLCSCVFSSLTRDDNN